MAFDLVERAEVERLAASAGLGVEHVSGDYDEGPFEPNSSPFMIFVLVERASRS